MRRKLGDGIAYLVLICGAIMMVFPFLWMFLCAFKTHYEVTQYPPQFLPEHFSLDNFITAFSMAPFLKYFANSLIVMVASVVCTTFTTILGAFAFHVCGFPDGKLCFPFF